MNRSSRPGNTHGWYCTDSSRFLSPKLTTLRQDSKTIGVRAADSLISLIESPKTTLIEKIVVPGELVEGESVRNMVLH